MPFFKIDELPGGVAGPGYSAAYGPTITGDQLEIGFYTEPKGAGAKPHRHKSEQIILILAGRLRVRIRDEVCEIGPGEVALIPSDQEHEQFALDENTRFVSFKSTVGQQPETGDVPM